MPSPSKLRCGPEHTNNNIICAIDIRVGGLDPSSCDVLEVCFVPLNHSFKVSGDFGLFHTLIRPSWPVDKRIAGLSEESLKDYRSAPDAVTALDMFETWVNEVLQFKKHKKIMPLVWDWTKLSPYLKIWLTGSYFTDFIHESIRDCLPLLNYVNDRHSIMGEEVPYKHPTFGQLVCRSDVELLERNSLMANCKALSDAYRVILSRRLP